MNNLFIIKLINLINFKIVTELFLVGVRLFMQTRCFNNNCCHYYFELHEFQNTYIEIHSEQHVDHLGSQKCNFSC